MTKVSENKACAVCGGNTFYEFDCSTNEQSEICLSESSGFTRSTELEENSGKKCWVETVVYPMDANGKVRRPADEK